MSIITHPFDNHFAVYPADVYDLLRELRYPSPVREQAANTRKEPKPSLAKFAYSASPLVDGTGYCFDFIVAGLDKKDVEVEVFREANWKPNTFSLRVKTLAANPFTPKTEVVLSLESNLDVSSASTALVNGILTVAFKYLVDSGKKSHKLEIK